MGKKALGIGLTLLSIALWVGPIVAAFGSHGWSLRDTVVPDQTQMNGIEDRIDGLVKEGSSSEDLFSFTESNLDGYDVSLNAEFKSPFNFALTIENLEITLTDSGVELCTVKMTEERIDLEPGGTKSLRLSGLLTEEGKSYLQGGEVPNDAEISNGILIVEASDITAEISLGRIQGGGGIF